jgi:spore maturation protein SpmA
MPLPLFSKIIGCLLQADTATSVAFDTIQHLINTRPLRQPSQLASKVLLQRLTALLSPALQCSVHILGNVPHQHVRHAYIMLSSALSCNLKGIGNAASTDCLQ